MVAPVLTPNYTSKPHLLADFNMMGIQWNSGTQSWQLEFTVTDDHGNVTSFTETYVPTPDDKVTIYDLCELLRPYFNLTDHPGLTGYGSIGLKCLDNSRRVKLVLAIHGVSSAEGWDGVINLNGDDTTISALYFVYSNATSGKLHSGTDATGGIGSRFLSRCNLLTAASEQPCAVSWFGHGETLKVKLLHYVNGIPQQTDLPDVTAEDTDNMQTYNFTLAALAEVAGIDVKNVICADLQLFLNSSPQDSMRFMHETRHRAHERVFAFIGAMGEPEFFAMTGSDNREAEYEGVFLMEHNDYRKADTTLRCIHTAHTGSLSEGERELLWDMAASPWVYVIENGQLREVTITEVELNDTVPHRVPIGFRVKWRYTSELAQRTFTRATEQNDITVISNDDTIHGLE